VCDRQESSLVLAKEAKNIQYGYEKQTFDWGAYRELEISLAGMAQFQNAPLALEAILCLQKLGYSITEQQIRQGLKKTQWRGRFTLIGREPLFFIDGAHNRDAAKILRKSLELYFTNRRIFYIMGIFKDKEYEEVAKITVPLAAHVITVETPGNPRALPAGELLEVVKKYQPSSEKADHISEAVEKCLKMANKDDVILAFGSLSFLGEVTRAVDNLKERKL
jgi:dihydrofolate synthase/folylpolyglutamate synthase